MNVTFRNYSQADLASALHGVECGLSPLDLDKIWAEHRLHEELGRIEEPKHIPLPCASQKEIEYELGALRSLKHRNPGSPAEL